MAGDDISLTKSPNGSLSYRLERPPDDCQVATLEIGKRTDGSYWARIEFRRGDGLTMSQWSCPNWAQLLADIDRKRTEYNCPLFPIEEPTAAHWA
jgi:hypothetical protein